MGRRELVNQIAIIVIVAADKKAYEGWTQFHPHCFMLKIFWERRFYEWGLFEVDLEENKVPSEHLGDGLELHFCGETIVIPPLF